MSRQFRLFPAVVALATGFAVAFAPLAIGHGEWCIGAPTMPGGCTAATSNPDWIAGFLVGAAAYILLVGLIPSARVLRKR